MSDRPSKKPRLCDDDSPSLPHIRLQRQAFLSSLGRDVSPPTSSRNVPEDATSGIDKVTVSRYPDASHSTTSQISKPALSTPTNVHSTKNFTRKRPDGLQQDTRIISSPFKLTNIRDAPSSSNVDTVRLEDILGNPLIKEAWVFNYCFDVDWMMQFFDSDVQQMVQVKIIHGSWRNEDSNRISIEEACRRWPNVQEAKAWLSDPFGTHHSKMFILFSHDDTAEVVMHTANMLAKDWTNMTQAVWRSGTLPRQTGPSEKRTGPIGSGSRFKRDLLAYLGSYKKACKELCQSLSEHDFSSVRGAIVASVPSKISSELHYSTEDEHLWGYPMLREVISSIKRPAKQRSATHTVIQVSSIATLPTGWLKSLIDATKRERPSRTSSDSLSVIFPTAENVARSLDGYAAGGSIHIKAQSPTHLKQIDNLRPHLRKWTHGTPSCKFSSGRALAAPHIKTYIQYNMTPTVDRLERGEVEIDWALLTSANLSTQAWGSLQKSSKESKTKSKTSGAEKVHIQSFEIGVLVWPELFLDTTDPEGDLKATTSHESRGQRRARIVPTFGTDVPDVSRVAGDEDDVIVGFRMPYDLPLVLYGPSELPWSPGNSYGEPDSHGMAWAPKGQ